jgi:hypothetical protein
MAQIMTLRVEDHPEAIPPNLLPSMQMYHYRQSVTTWAPMDQISCGLTGPLLFQAQSYCDICMWIHFTLLFQLLKLSIHTGLTYSLSFILTQIAYFTPHPS